MKLTTPQEIRQVIDEIYALPDLFLLDSNDFDKYFSTIEGLQAFRIAGQSVPEIAEKLKKELPDGFSPRKLLVHYIGLDLRMQEIADLDEAFGTPERWKRGIILAPLPYGRITVYVFYKDDSGYGKI